MVLIVTGIAACTHPEAMQRRMLTFIRNGSGREFSAKLSGLAQVTVHVYKPSVDPKEKGCLIRGCKQSER